MDTVAPATDRRRVRLDRTTLLLLWVSAALGLSLWMAGTAQPAAGLAVPLVIGLLGGRAWMQRDLTRSYVERDAALQRAAAHEALVCRMRREDHRCPVDCESGNRIATLQQEVQSLREQKTRYESIAQHDVLTGLANRLLLADRFESAVQRALRRGDGFGLMMVDLNGFKRINDEHGHAVGDKVLMQVACRLCAAVRGSDTVARLGGDEFVLIVEALDHLDDLQGMVDKISEVMIQPLVIDGQALPIGASIGVASFPADGATLDEVLNVADRAMYACKTASQFGALRR